MKKQNESSSEIMNLQGWCEYCSEPVYQSMQFVIIPSIVGNVYLYCKGHEPKQPLEDEDD